MNEQERRFRTRNTEVLQRIRFFTGREYYKTFIHGLEKADIGELITKSHEYQELFFAVPLWLCLTELFGRKFCIGKIREENYPYDVMLVPEDAPKQLYGDKEYIQEQFSIQIKQIISYKQTDQKSQEEWKRLVEETLKKACLKSASDVGGSLLIWSSIDLLPVNGHEFDKTLRSISIPENNKFLFIALTAFVQTSRSDYDYVTWELYPHFGCLGIMDEKQVLRIKTRGLD